MSSVMRGLVSKKKKRYQKDGFDLDLTYITPQVIAMGFPSTGREASYRNPMTEVQRFFDLKHKGHVRVYNLCSEREYDPASFESCTRFPFDDHNPCPLSVLQACCEDVHEFLSKDPQNVAAIHCKAGKGRTGLIISAYLVYAGICATASQALKLYGETRTYNGKGVTIPSQMRYVHYFENRLRAGPAVEHTYKLRHVRLVTVPNFDVGGGCDPYFDVRIRGGKVKVFDYKKAVGKVKGFKTRDKFADLDCSAFDIRVRGDVKLVFWDYDRVGTPDKMFHFWFNTAYIFNSYLCFHKPFVDRACKDKGHKEFEEDFKVELFLDRIDDTGEIEGEIVELDASDVDETDDEGEHEK